MEGKPKYYAHYCQHLIYLNGARGGPSFTYIPSIATACCALCCDQLLNAPVHELVAINLV
jgi:hypothetical protein